MKLCINAAALALGLALSVADAGVLPVNGAAGAQPATKRWLATGWVRLDGKSPRLWLGMLIRFDGAPAPVASQPEPDAPH